MFLSTAKKVSRLKKIKNYIEKTPREAVSDFMQKTLHGYHHAANLVDQGVVFRGADGFWHWKNSSKITNKLADELFEGGNRRATKYRIANHSKKNKVSSPKGNKIVESVVEGTPNQMLAQMEELNNRVIILNARIDSMVKKGEDSDNRVRLYVSDMRQDMGRLVTRIPELVGEGISSAMNRPVTEKDGEHAT